MAYASWYLLRHTLQSVITRAAHFTFICGTVLTLSCNAQKFRAPFSPIILAEGDPETRIATVYCHGYEHTQWQALDYLSLPPKCVQTCLLPGIVVSFNFADAGRNPFRLNRAQSCMGQCNEIERVNAAIKYAHTLDVDTIVVYGLSRGATALIGALGTYGHTYDKVCIAILESPFADLQDVILHVYQRIRRFIPQSWFIKIFRTFCAQNWDDNAATALSLVQNIPEHIALQFIATDTDHLVPVESTKKLYNAISKRDNTHFNIVKGGRHGHLVKQATATLYAEIIDTFYKRYIETA